MNDNEIWELAVKKVNNSLSDEDRERYNEIKDREDFQKNLKEAEKIHSRSFDSFLFHQIDKEKSWRKINSEINSSRQIRKLIISSSKYAAIFIIALFTGLFLQNTLINHQKKGTVNRIEVEWGQMSKLTLSDSTLVWLNAGTTFEYPAMFNTRARNVKLNGEAQFKVSHNRKIPFEVMTETGIVKVHGTTFDVKSYDEERDLVVTLIEGKVEVENSKGELLATLNPSEQISVNKQTGAIMLKTVDTRFYSSWIEGKIVLDETKLTDLVTILERWYNIDIKLVGENIGDLKVTGTIIRGEPIDFFLRIIERMYNIRCEIKTNSDKKCEIIIHKKQLPMRREPNC